MVKISAVIITLNEEKNIERCIRSVQSVADEILVVDSFSTDKNRANMQGFGCQILFN
jgi:glycosyltransferase involved in cell wall biosynthesis